MPNKLGKRKIIFASPAQPEIRGARRCASEASGRHIPTLRPTKMSRGACHCATEVLTTGIATLREFRVGEPGFRQLAAHGRQFYAVCEGLRCATGRNRPLAHRERPSDAFYWESMCGYLADRRQEGGQEIAGQARDEEGRDSGCPWGGREFGRAAKTRNGV